MRHLRQMISFFDYIILANSIFIFMPKIWALRDAEIEVNFGVRSIYILAFWATIADMDLKWENHNEARRDFVVVAFVFGKIKTYFRAQHLWKWGTRQ